MPRRRRQRRPFIDLQALARAGAATRLYELRDEIAAIHRAFPGLGSGSTHVGRPRRRPGRSPSLANTASAGHARRRRRGKLSAAGRAAISAAQKKRWAAIKKEKANAAKKP